MEHDIDLNIHYTAPRSVWDKIDAVYRDMAYWEGYRPCAHWAGDQVDLWASVEPSGIQIFGTMPEDVWEDWIQTLKKKLTDALGYKIGEPDEGFEFRYQW